MAQAALSFLSHSFQGDVLLFVSNLVAFGVGVYSKMLHSKYTTDDDIVERLTKENAALKELIDPVNNVKIQDLAKEIGALKEQVLQMKQTTL